MFGAYYCAACFCWLYCAFVVGCAQTKRLNTSLVINYSVNKSIVLLLCALFLVVFTTPVFSASPSFADGLYCTNDYVGSDRNYYDYQATFWSGVASDSDGDLDETSCEVTYDAGATWLTGILDVGWDGDRNECYATLDVGATYEDDIQVGFRISDDAFADDLTAKLIWWLDNNSPTTSISNNSGLISFSCVDHATNTGVGSGCDSTTYDLDGAGMVEYTAPFTISEGSHTIDYNSADNFGNVEVTKTWTGEVGIVVELDNYSKIINNTASIGEGVAQGVADNGNLIGLIIGIGISVSLLFGLIVVVIGSIFLVVRKIKINK